MKKKLLFLSLFLSLFQLIIVAGGNKRQIEKTDYVQIILYGQSLGMGWECPRAITTEALAGNYMIGDNVLMKYNNGQAALNPLTATLWSQGGEQPVVSCMNVFSKMYRDNVDATQKFIAMTGGEGGQTIERLSKECTNSGFYYTFTNILDKTTEALSSTQSTVSCPAIIYMQGEYNCNNSSWYGGRGMTPGSDGTINKDVYKALLLKLKNNMQSDIMAKYGQSQKPLFFIYQTSGNYIKDKDMPITMAQLEFANENEDVVLLNPHYAMPDYNGGHLSTNGYRWYGETMGRIIYDELVDNKSYETLHPENFVVADSSVTIDYHVPALPLIFDTWTTPRVSNYGFCVYKNNNPVSIKKVEIQENKVVIACNDTLLGTIEVVYAGSTTSGSGNLRDSSTKTSMYSYFDDSSDSKKESYTPRTSDGVLLYNKPYPLENWSVGFYHKTDIAEPGTETELSVVHSATDNLSQEIATQIGQGNASNIKFLSVLGTADLSYADCRSIVTTFPNLVGLDVSAVRFSGNIIPANAFSQLSASDIKLPVAIGSIGVSAFADCKNLKSLILYGASVSDGAFTGCSNLEAVYFNVVELPANTGASAFVNNLKVFVPYGKASSYASLSNVVVQDGTLSNPYKIGSANDLDAMRLYNLQYEANAELSGDVDLADWIEDNASKDIRTNGWQPIESISGTVDGKGYFVKNLWINRPSANDVGLFGILKGNTSNACTLKNLGIRIADGMSIVGNQQVGGVAGSTSDKVRIEQVCVGGSIHGEKSVGGIIGSDYAETTIKQCYTNGRVVANGDASGGLVGVHYSGNLKLTIDMCYSASSITASSTGGSCAGLVGGVSHSASVTPTVTLLDVRNSVAVNPSVDGKTVGRITGWERTASASAYTNNYAYAAMTLNGSVASGSNGGTKSGLDKSAEELKQQDTYSTWNFSDVWKMGNLKYQLPILKSVNSDGQPNTALSYLGASSGIGRSDEIIKISIYPNPTDGIVYIKDKKEVNSLVHLYDNAGRLLMKSRQNAVDLSSFDDGVYLLKTENSVFRIIKRISSK